MKYFSEASKGTQKDIVDILSKPIYNSSNKLNSDLKNYIDFKNTLKHDEDALGYFKHLLRSVNLLDSLEGGATLSGWQNKIKQKLINPKMIYHGISNEERFILSKLNSRKVRDDLQQILYLEPEKAKLLNLSDKFITYLGSLVSNVFKGLHELSSGESNLSSLVSSIDLALEEFNKLDDLNIDSINLDIQALNLLKSNLESNPNFSVTHEKIKGREELLSLLKSQSGRFKLASILKGYLLDNFELDNAGVPKQRQFQISEEGNMEKDNTENKKETLNKPTQNSEEIITASNEEEQDFPDEAFKEPEDATTKEEKTEGSNPADTSIEDSNSIPLLIYASNDLPSLEYFHKVFDEYINKPVKCIITDKLSENKPVEQVKEVIFKGMDNIPLYYNKDNVNSTDWAKRTLKYIKDNNGILLCVDYNKRGSPYASLLRYAGSSGIETIRVELKTSRDKTKTYERIFIDGEMVQNTFPASSGAANDSSINKIDSQPAQTSMGSQSAANDSSIAEPDPDNKDYDTFLNQTGSQTPSNGATVNSNKTKGTSTSNTQKNQPVAQNSASSNNSNTIDQNQLKHVGSDVENNYIRNELKNTLLELSKYSMEQEDISPQELQDFIYNNLDKYFKHIQDGTPVWNNKRALQRYCQLALKDKELSKNTKKMFKDIFKNYSLTPNGSLIPDKLFLSDNPLSSGEYSALYMKPLTYQATWAKGMKKQGSKLAKTANKLLGWTNTRFAESIES